MKQICLGVAVAGAVAGGGSIAGAAVAYAETDTDSGSGSSSSASSASSSSGAAGRKSLREQRRAVVTERLKVRADVAERSERLAAAVEAARTAKDRDRDIERLDVTKGISRAVDSIADASTTLRRSVEVRVGEERRTPAKALTAFLKSLPTLPKPAPVKAPSQPSPLLPFALAGANTTAVSTTRRADSAPEAAVQTTSAPTQRVLVIGVDGVNLSKILDDPDTNDKFIDLMNSGTTSATSIAGHTTISNPSWTAILTGVWDNKSGVVNNIFNPAPYNKWPTVFDQLEGANPDIRTKVIADWDVITDIANAGTYGADDVVLIGQVAGDSDWSQTDAKVTEEAIKSILGTEAGYEEVPNFLFTYLVQVDEAGHAHGGDSQQYADALARTDENLGAIVDAVRAREAASCAAGACEEWTIIVVTDHGHQPQVGFGHGFQSPRETSAFVIADGPGFGVGEMNLGYEIVDVTPTVVKLFGIDPTLDADGKPLMDRSGGQVDPDDLQQALQEQIDSYGWPDPATTFTLSVRTIFTSIPYFVVQITNSITSQLNDIASQGIPVVSQLAAVVVIPVQLIGDALFAVTDVIAQIVARLTGAGVIPPSAPSELRESADPILWPEAAIAV
ncbi:alkaline phosphatase family protein [Mycobacterium sp. ACS4331]|uniref:alkaline phosphatase family protein n=1 Tax=Mycobacterium sp. ACS4331 TaxID=1834121 RepID=UPI0007FEF110|nr:alkaline phosphatase family protein [Mycobacterium sp. ACS4331]OBF29782.1 hypothetical protein A5727_23230 [Mycobacterium sp. ACS4331]